MVCFLAALREAHALFASLPKTNYAAVATTARRVVAFVLALSLPPARSVALAGVAASCLRLALRCTASSLRRLAREVGGSFPVELRLLPRLASPIIAAMRRCLPMPTRIRPNPAFNPDAPPAWLHTPSRMRAVARLAGAPVNFALGIWTIILSEPTEIPALFGSSWPQFVHEWCLGTPPATAPEVCVRALEALLVHWPERAHALAAGPIRGLSVVANAIDIGLILTDATPLQGVEPVLSRLRAGERGSFSELTVGSALLRLGLRPEFGVAAGMKVPDLALTIGSATIFVEVFAPDRSEIVKHFTEGVGEMASAILAVSSNANVELFLDCDLDELDTPTLARTIGDAAFSDAVQSIPLVGRFLKRRLSFPPIVSPSVPSETSGIVLGVARSIVNSDQVTGALVAVRGGVFDGRAKRLLSAKLQQLPKTNPNLVVIDTGNVPGGLHDWVPSITRCFQPAQNTRISAVVLYFTGIMGNPLQTHRAWRMLINPHAANPLPAQLCEALAKLPTALPAAQQSVRADREAWRLR